ncbi:hypothetical protein D3C81_496210 [compost metagenome]
MRRRDFVQTVPDCLGQPGPGEKEQLHARKKALPELRVHFQRRHELLPALGHGQVSGGGDFAKVAQGLRKVLGGWLAIINVKAATVVQHDTDVMAAPKGVIPRQPINQQRRFKGELREGLAEHLLIRTKHLLGGDDRLGQSCRTGREQELGNRRRLHRLESLVGIGALGLPQQLVERQVVAPWQAPRRQQHRRICSDDSLDGSGIGIAVGGEDQPRFKGRHNVPELVEIPRNRRVSRRNRAVRNAAVHRRTGQLQVLQIIAREDHQRPLLAELEPYQVLRD